MREWVGARLILRRGERTESLAFRVEEPKPGGR